MEERECINQKLNDIIKRRIPEEIKSMPFLMDLLQISRESVYRRLRGEVSYTMREATLLSSKLNISFDELFDYVNNKENAYINFSTARASSPEDNYVEMMKSTIRVFDNMPENQSVKMYYVGNKIVNGVASFTRTRIKD